jgi:hypothetical protein
VETTTNPAPSTTSGTTRQEIPMKIDAYLFVPGSTAEAMKFYQGVFGEA